MFSTIISNISVCISQAWAWFSNITSAVPGSLQFIIGIILLSLIYRFILAPFLETGWSGKSDRVSGQTLDLNKPVNTVKFLEKRD